MLLFIELEANRRPITSMQYEYGLDLVSALVSLICLSYHCVSYDKSVGLMSLL